MELERITATPYPEYVVAQCARNDYMEEWVGNKPLSEILEEVKVEEWHREYAEDELTGYEEYGPALVSLINKLLRQGHFGPFEHPHATFAIKGLSRVAMQQLVRHRHATYDIQSQRYVDLGDKDLVVPPSIEEAGNWTGQDGTVAEVASDVFDAAVAKGKSTFRSLRKANVPKEDARFVRGQGLPVNVTFTMNARALMHLFDMRLAGDAQWEIREMTELVYDEFARWMPITHTYYDDNLRGRKNRLGP